MGWNGYNSNWQKFANDLLSERKEISTEGLSEEERYLFNRGRTVSVPIKALESVFSYFYLSNSSPLEREKDKVFERTEINGFPGVIQYPRIPKYPLSSEDKITPRISLGDSITKAAKAKAETHSDYYVVACGGKSGLNPPKGSIVDLSEEIRKKLQTPWTVDSGGWLITPQMYKRFLNKHRKEKAFNPFENPKSLTISLHDYENLFEEYQELHRYIVSEVEAFRKDPDLGREFNIGNVDRLLRLILEIIFAKKSYNLDLNWSEKNYYGGKELPEKDTQQGVLNNLLRNVVSDSVSSKEYWSIEPIALYYVGQKDEGGEFLNVATDFYFEIIRPNLESYWIDEINRINSRARDEQEEEKISEEKMAAEREKIGEEVKDSIIQQIKDHLEANKRFLKNSNIGSGPAAMKIFHFLYGRFLHGEQYSKFTKNTKTKDFIRSYITFDIDFRFYDDGNLSDYDVDCQFLRELEEEELSENAIFTIIFPLYFMNLLDLEMAKELEESQNFLSNFKKRPYLDAHKYEQQTLLENQTFAKWKKMFTNSGKTSYNQTGEKNA
jgi:hypothetical protein